MYISRADFFVATMAHLLQTEPIPQIEQGPGLRVRHTQGGPSVWMGTNRI